MANQERGANQKGDGEPAALGEAEVFEKVRRAVLTLIPPSASSRALPGASLQELGIDSLKVVELSLVLEEAFREPVFLPDWFGTAERAEDLTLGALAAYILKLLAPSR